MLATWLAGCAMTTRPEVNLTPLEELEPEVVPAPTMLVEYPPIEAVEPLPPASTPAAAPTAAPGQDTMAMAAPSPSSAVAPPVRGPGDQHRRPAVDRTARRSAAVRKPFAGRTPARNGRRDAGAGKAAYRCQQGSPGGPLFVVARQSPGRPAGDAAPRQRREGQSRIALRSSSSLSSCRRRSPSACARCATSSKGQRPPCRSWRRSARWSAA